VASDVSLYPPSHRRLPRGLTIRNNLLHHHRVYTAHLPHLGIGSNEERCIIALGRDWRDWRMGIEYRGRRLGRGMDVCERRGQGQQGIMMQGVRLRLSSTQPAGGDARAGIRHSPTIQDGPSIQLSHSHASSPHVPNRCIRRGTTSRLVRIHSEFGVDFCAPQSGDRQARIV
jgi:hypothetical protein